MGKLRLIKKPALDQRVDWPQHVAAWRAAGQSAAAYCRRHGLTYSAFSYWKRKLDTPESPKPAPGFVRLDVAPLPLASSSSQALASDRQLDAGIAIHRAGMEIRLKQGFDGAELKRLLHLIGGPSC